MKVLLLILFLVFSTVTFAQNVTEKKNLIYEQIALDFFTDSLLNNKEPFLKTQVYFDGKVDSSITLLGESCISSKYYKVKDEALEQHLNLEAKADNNYYRNNKKTTFSLEVREPVKNKSIKAIAPKRSTRIIKIFQNKSIGDKNYVWFRLFSKDGWRGEDLYLTMNNNGDVLEWCYLSFIF